MRVAITATVILLAVGAVLLLVTQARAQLSSGTQKESRTNKPAEPKDVYAGFRNLMLQGPRSKFGLAPTSKPTEPWGVLMDWGMQRGTATVVATADGSASVYFSNGGGYIGGKGQEPIRAAAQNAVEVAHTIQLPAQPTTTYPLPEEHGVFFYLLTDAGVFMFRASDQDMNSHGHPLRKLGDAMQGIITQYRLWDERRKSVSK